MSLVIYGLNSFGATNPIKHTCKSKEGSAVRTLEVQFPTGDGSPKCETKYVKENKEEKVLFKAMNETDYCEKKTEEFIQNKLTSWECTKE